MQPLQLASSNTGHVVLVVSLLCFLSTAHADAAQLHAISLTSAVEQPDFLSEEFLEESDAVIRDITIDSGDVFDPDDPAEDGFFYHLVNALHVETKDEVIRRQLLMQPGDPFTAGELAEAARMLRKNSFLREAEIVPVRYEEGYVDLEVITEDTWSLTPSLSFSHKGGKSTGGFEIEESNLFGSGSEIKLGFKSEIDRDELFFGYRDQQLGDSRLDLGLAFADNSDGSAYQLLLQQPFYALDARRAGGVRVNGFHQVDPLYQQGEVYDELQHVAKEAELFYGWSDGLHGGWVRRFTVGLGYDEHTFTAMPGFGLPEEAPQDRRDIYPFVGVEWLEDRFEKTRNADNIERVEDRHLGARIYSRLGYASESLGSGTDAWLFELGTARGFRPRDGDTLLLHSTFESRWVADGQNHYALEAGARYYHRQSERRLLYAELTGVTGQQFDSNQLPTLGGDTGLRGYPIRYQTGDSQVLLTLEQRIFTDWYPFRLFRVGGAAFFDAGRVWGGGAETGNLGLLRDVGLGLRIASPRSSTGRMLHIDVAWPLDGPPDIRGPQFILETSRSF